MTHYRQRDVEAEMKAALRSMPAVVVTGPRQSGKTTFLQRDAIFANRRYLTLDDHETLTAARNAPQEFVSGDEPLIIDEAQRCPELLTAIKRAVDRNRRPGHFVLSGSANFALMKSVGESLAGRAAYFELLPFSRRETREVTTESPFLSRFFDRPTIPNKTEFARLDDREIMLGGFPSVVLGETDRPDIWFRGYTSTYVERDVRHLAQVADLTAFRTLLELVALRTGGLLNQSELGRDIKLTATTVARWIGIMETSYVIRRLPPFLKSKASRLVKNPKVYLCDSGLAAHLARINGAAQLAKARLRGALVETFVAQNLRAILSAHRPDLELSFWNVQGRHEVDFIVHDSTRALAIELKSTEKFDDRDISTLQAFMDSTPTAVAGLIAYQGRSVLPLGPKLFAIPIGLLLA